jgi:hypothetical protein
MTRFLSGAPEPDRPRLNLLGRPDVIGRELGRWDWQGTRDYQRSGSLMHLWPLAFIFGVLAWVLIASNG